LKTRKPVDVRDADFSRVLTGRFVASRKIMQQVSEQRPFFRSRTYVVTHHEPNIAHQFRCEKDNFHYIYQQLAL
jgi:hypothetical protein